LAKNGKEYELAIKIAGEVEKSFMNSTKLTKRQLSSIARQAADSSKSMSESFDEGLALTGKGFNKIEKAASSSFKIIEKAAVATALAVTGIVTASATAGIQYESAFAGVKKTTEATAEEYAAISDKILEMTEKMPSSAAEIAEVAEAAGQLGIQKDNLLDFTEVMINLGESTNLTATDGASSLAKFANITQMAADKYSNLGSVIVELGNNFATTESDIVDMATNLASTGELAGLSEAQIMGISAAMSSVGLEAEAGGTAMSKLLKKIQVAVETGSSDLNDYAKVAGLTADQFKKSFQDDAVVALASFIDGLNDTEKNGKSATVILEDMGLTEVRLSNTILSLANSNGLMTDAVGMANDAWVENTALSEEAAKRYETMESKLSILKNAVTETGIKLYEEYSEPMAEAVDASTKFVTGLKDNVIPVLVDDFKNKLPTVIRKTREFGKSFTEFASPVIKVGKWIADHPDLISSFLIGIGSSLVAFKVAVGVQTLTKAFAGLGAILTNPFALAITAVALAIGGAAGIAAYVKKANKEMKEQNLADHFGSISLSLDEIQSIATRMIETDKLGKLADTMSALAELDGFSDAIESSIDEVNKMNWQVGVGITLDEDEQSAYKAAIEDFIDNSEDLILQNQYAVSLALELYYGEGDSSSNIKEKMNQFYTDTYNEVSELGTKLQNATNDAFEDGLLDIDEAAVIADYMKQMSEITQKIADAEFQANLNVISMNFSGEKLTSDSFENLMSEINTQVDAAKADYEEALKYDLSQNELSFSEGYLNQDEYEKANETAKKQYLSQVSALESNANSFAYNTIMESYGEDFQNAVEGLYKSLDENMEYISSDGANLTLFWDTITSNLEDYDGIDKSTKAALKELFELMPSVDSMEELKNSYVLAGEEIPTWISEGLDNASLIGALVGDEDSLWALIEKSIDQNPEYKDMIDRIKEQGGYIPEAVAASITENKQAAIDSFSDFMNSLGIAQTSTIVPMVSGSSAEIKSFSTLGIPGYANGDIISSPTLATFAEKVPEAAIPINGSSRSKNLWKLTGRLLGIDQSEDSFGNLYNRLEKVDADGGSTEIVFKPSYNFYGEAPSEKDLINAGRITQEEFSDMMDRYLHDNCRVSLA